jgi:hypothetical protein
MKEMRVECCLSDANICELTKLVENGNHGALVKQLQKLSSAWERHEVLRRIALLNQENRFKSGRVPRLALVENTYSDSDFIDVSLLKKSSDWLFNDDVLYRESFCKEGFAPGSVSGHPGIGAVLGLAC